MMIIKVFFLVSGVLSMIGIIILAVSVFFFWVTGGFREDNMLYEKYCEERDDEDKIDWSKIQP